jgi:hypothetical protein
VKTRQTMASEAAEVAELKEIFDRDAQSSHQQPQRSSKKKAGSKKRRAARSARSKPLPAWDASPHRPVPSALRGQSCEREPWGADARGWYADRMDGNGAIGRIRKQLDSVLADDLAAEPSSTEQSHTPAGEAGSRGGVGAKASFSLKEPTPRWPRPRSPGRKDPWAATGRQNGASTFECAMPAASKRSSSMFADTCAMTNTGMRASTQTSPHTRSQSRRRNRMLFGAVEQARPNGAPSPHRPRAVIAVHVVYKPRHVRACRSHTRIACHSLLA